MTPQDLYQDLLSSFQAAVNAGAEGDDPCWRGTAPTDTLGGVKGTVVVHKDSRPDGNHIVMFSVRQTATLIERLEASGVLQGVR